MPDTSRPSEAERGGPPPRLWLHAPTAEAEPAAAFIARRLSDTIEPLELVRTGPADPVDPLAISGLILRHRPRLTLIVGGRLPPGIGQIATQRGLRIVMAGADATMAPAPPRPAPEAGLRGWVARLRGLGAPAPGSVPLSAEAVAHVLVTDAEAEAAFLAAGLPPEVVSITGPLEEPSRAPRVNETERAVLARAIGTRPAWLAIGLPEAEMDLVAAAHRLALRAAHRLLLVVVPEDPARGAAMASHLAEVHGLAVARRGADQDPEPEAEVYVADTEGEEGLWLRLAPTVWIGGSASAGAARHPFVVAAAGAAILHGPAPGPHGSAFARLQSGGASREVTDAQALGAEIAELLAPDAAARMARAAWEVCSAGTETTERLIAIVARMLAAAQSDAPDRGAP